MISSCRDDIAGIIKKDRNFQGFYKEIKDKLEI